MNFLQLSLTRKLTAAILKKGAEEGSVETDTHRVEQVPIFQRFLRCFAAAGLILSGVALFVSHEIMAALLLLLFCEGLSVPVLISYHTCWITYDESGFTHSTFWGRKYQYSYEDVTGLVCSGSRVEIEVCGQKRIQMDETWINRQDFAHFIRKHRSQKPPKLAPSVVGMSMAEISDSYQKGVLRQALLVCSKEDQARFPRFKILHYGICSLSLLLTIICFLTISESSQMFLGYLLLIGFINLLWVAALALYFRYPMYFTMREIPCDIDFDRSIRANHKRSTFVAASVCSLLPNILFLILCTHSIPDALHPVLWAALAGVLALIVFIALLHLFRCYSWEYRHYKVGLITFTICLLVCCVGLFMLLFGSLLFFF